MPAKIAFLAMVERGDLARKTVLLAESIREFTGAFRDSSIWAVQPRPGRPPAAAALDALARNDVIFLRAYLNRTWQDYGPGNKPYAAAFIEELVENTADVLVLLDSDILFLRPPDELVPQDDVVVAVRPVDEAHLGSPLDEPVNDYWNFLYDTCGVAPSDVWDVRTTSDRRDIRAYFNAGFVAVRPKAGLFRRWRDNMDRIARYRDDSRIFRTDRERWFLDQTCLAATILASTTRRQVKVLDRSYNYPLHKQARLPAGEKITALRDAVAVHYHEEFYGLRWMANIEVANREAHWLRERLPLPRLAARLRKLGKVPIRLAAALPAGRAAP